MKFSALKIGDRFFFEGREYIKTSPMLACDSNGKSKLIPRSAKLQSHPSQNSPTTHARDSKLDQLYHTTTTIIQQEVLDSDLKLKLGHAIEKAWKNIKEDTN